MTFLILSLLFYLLQNFGNKEFNRRSKDISFKEKSLMQNGVCVLIASFVMLLAGGGKIMSLPLMLMAVLFGICYLLTIFLLLRSFDGGTLGTSTLLCNLGMFISAMYGVIRFNDKFTFRIAVAMVCMVVAVILCNAENKTVNKKSFWLALLSGVMNGLVASVKREAIALTETDPKNFLFWGFFFSGMIVVAVSLFNAKEIKKGINKKCVLLFSVFGTCAGVGTACANLFQMKALEKGLSSAIVYPFTAGFLVVSLWLVSLLVYKEVRLKITNVLAVLLCVTAIALM